MIKYVTLFFILFSCSPNKTNFKKLEDKNSQSVEQVFKKESPVFLSKENPSWKPFLLIGLIIFATCSFSAKNSIKKTYLKIKNKFDKK